MQQTTRSSGRVVMSEDARNSIYLWVGSLAFFGLFWASLHFDFPIGISDRWIWPLFGVIAIIDIGMTGWGLWKHRASSTDNSNKS